MAYLSSLCLQQIIMASAHGKEHPGLSSLLGFTFRTTNVPEDHLRERGIPFPPGCWEFYLRPVLTDAPRALFSAVGIQADTQRSHLSIPLFR